MEKISINLDDETHRELEEYWRTQGYKNRSEAVREALDEFLGGEESGPQEVPV